MSAFMLWSNHMRPKIRAESPDLKITEISKVLGEKWKEIGEEAKKEWRFPGTSENCEKIAKIAKK